MYFIHFLSPSSSNLPSIRCYSLNILSYSSLSLERSYSFLLAAKSSLLIALLKSDLCCLSLSIISFRKEIVSVSLSNSLGGDSSMVFFWRSGKADGGGDHSVDKGCLAETTVLPPNVFYPLKKSNLYPSSLIFFIKWSICD